jgi:hypothetical protein
MHRGSDRSAGGDAIVDENDRPSVQARTKQRAAISVLAAGQLGEGVVHGMLDRVMRDTQLTHNRLVNESAAARRDRSHEAPRVVRYAELVKHQDVEGRR